MRIGILNWRDRDHPGSGGSEVYVHEVAREWTDLGHDAAICSSAFRGAPARDADGSVRILRKGTLRSGAHHAVGPSHLIKDFGPDVILESVNTIPYALPLAHRHQGIPFLTLVHQMAKDVWRAHLPAPLAPLAARIEGASWRPYRGVPVGAVSRSTADDLRGAGVAAEVFPQGGNGPQPLPEKEVEPTFVFVGRLTPNKRPDHALDAFLRIRERLPAARLWMIGEGSMTGELRRRLPPGSEILHGVSREDLLDRMGRAHLLLTTSVREGWGLAVTEANSVGTPAIAYDVAGLRDSVRDKETGLLVPPEPQRLAEAAIDLLALPDAYERMRSQAARWGGSFTWTRTADSLLQKLQMLVADGERTVA